MPRVTSYSDAGVSGPARVRTRPLADTTLRVRPSPEDYGAQVGDTLARIGTNSATTIATAERERQDQRLVQEAKAKYMAWESARLYDPQQGAFTVKGKDALGLLDSVPGEFDTRVGELQADLKNERQRADFEAFVGQRRVLLDTDLRKHVYQQQTAYDNDEAKALLDLHTQSAIAHADNPAVVSQELANIVGETQKFAMRNGLGSDAAQALLLERSTAVHTGIIDSLLAQQKDQAAQVYFDATKDQIDGATQVKLRRALEEGTTQGTGLRAATDIWTQLGPKTDDDPIALDKMEDAARERFADNPKALDATMKYLRERKVAVDEGRKERDAAISGGLWKMAASGASLTTITHSPEYRDAPGRIQAQIADYVVARAERQASRAAAEESRAYTREQRVEAQRNKVGLYMYYQYAKPDILNQMSDDQIWALTPDIGERNAAQLLEDKRKFATDKAAAREVSIDTDQFNQLANEAGFAVFATKKSEDDKAAIGQLRNDVETAIAVEQSRLKKPLSRDEKQQVMQGVIDRRVMVDGWFGDSERVASSVVNASDRANAYIPVTKIPPQRLAFVTNYLRSTKPAYQRLTDQQIQQRAQAAIQRAYAASVLGLGQEEVQRRLAEAP